MNKIYKVIWNSARQCYVVVNEYAKCNGKKAQSIVMAGLLAASLGMAVDAHAADIYGEKVDGDGEASNAPSVTVTSDVEGSVYGGYVGGKGKANTNKVTVKSGSRVNDNVYGGYVGDAGEVKGNVVTIEGESAVAPGHDSAVFYTYGGYVGGSGEASDNHVIFDKFIEVKTIFQTYGGYVKGDGEAHGNTITINGDGTQNLGNEHELYGARIDGQNNGEYVNKATKNIITITNINKATDSHAIYGAYLAGRGNADYNEVTLTDVKSANDEIYGGYVKSNNNKDIFNSASYNKVTIKTVKLEASNSIGSIVGGYVEGDGTANENIVEISNVKKLSEVVGGYVENNGEANKNTVTLENSSTITGNIYGGYVDGKGSAKGNTVAINNVTTIEGNVFGGYVGVKDGDASGNTIGIADTVTFGANSVIYGGATYDSSIFNYVPVKTGNTLNLTNTKIELANIAGFENINYDVENLKKDDKIIHLTTSDNTDIDGTKVTFKGTLDPTSTITTGDKIYLINKDGGTLEGTIADDSTKSGTIKEGTSIEHDYTIEKEDDQHLVLTLGESREIEEEKPEDTTKPEETTKPEPTKPEEPGTRLTEDSKIYVESRLAEVGMVNASADQFVQSVLPQAVALSGTEAGYVPFASIIGGKIKMETGSHVDLKQRAVNIGFAKTIQKDGGSKLTFGPFFEYGKGDFDSYLDNGTKGEGDVTTTGGGLFIRNEGSSGLYVEGSLRAGRVKADTESKNLGTSYNTSSTYYGAHLGVGKLNEVGNGNTLDTYARYLYSHTGGDDVTLNNGEKYDFDSVDSNRLQLGARYHFNNGLYLGAAWQYEASGTAKATYVKYNLETAAPSIHGHSGIYELGWKHEDATNWDFDVAVTGYSGKERGATFRLGAAYHF